LGGSKQDTSYPSPGQEKERRHIRIELRLVFENAKGDAKSMIRSRTPKPLWDSVQCWLCHTTQAVEVVTDDTQDIGEYFHFDWYQPVYHSDEKKVFPEEREQLGRWSGPALCFWIRKGNGQVVSRTTKRTITAEDIRLNVHLAASIAAKQAPKPV
jgi:hypothetical protein